jgi:hypothetical protein
VPTIAGLSDGDEILRLLEVEIDGTAVSLRVHPPESRGLDAVVDLSEFRSALSAGQGRILGKTQGKGAPRICELESQPEGLLVKISNQSESESYWVTIRHADIPSIIGQA